eukprot:1196424-Prorocentrum_minimum.AAC.2
MNTTLRGGRTKHSIFPTLCVLSVSYLCPFCPLSLVSVLSVSLSLSLSLSLSSKFHRPHRTRNASLTRSLTHLRRLERPGARRSAWRASAHFCTASCFNINGCAVRLVSITWGSITTPTVAVSAPAASASEGIARVGCSLRVVTASCSKLPPVMCESNTNCAGSCEGAASSTMVSLTCVTQMPRLVTQSVTHV